MTSPAPQPAARATVGILLTRILAYPLGLVASALTARWLGPHDQGLYAFLLLLGSFVLPMAMLGFGAGIVYFLSSHRYDVRDVLLSGLLVGAVQGLMAALLFVVLWYLDALGEGMPVDGRLLGATLALAPLQGMQLMGERVLYGQAWFGLSNLLTLLQATLLPALLLGLVPAAGLGLPGAVLASVITTGTVWAATVVLLVRRCRPRWRLHWPFMGEALRYGLRMWVADLGTRATLRLDQLLLGLLVGPSALGHYVVAVRLSELLWMLPDAVAPVLFSRLAGTASEAERVGLTNRVHRVQVGVLVLLGAGLGAAGWVGIPWLFGAAYAPARPLLVWLVLGAVALLSAKVLTKFFAARGTPEYASAMGIFAAAVLGGVGLVLIPWLQATGAAVASALAYTTMSAAAVYFYRRQSRASTVQLFLPRLDDVRWARAQLAQVRGGRHRVAH